MQVYCILYICTSIAQAIGSGQIVLQIYENLMIKDSRSVKQLFPRPSWVDPWYIKAMWHASLGQGC